MTETNNKLRAVFLAALMFLAVFAGSVALAGSAAASHNEEADYDLRWENGATAYQGQTLMFDTTDQSQFELHTTDDADSHVRDLAFYDAGHDDDTRYALINTDDLEGDYEIRRDDGTSQGTMTIREQVLDAHWSPNPTDGESTLKLASNRNEYEVEVTSEDLDRSELRSIFSDRVGTTDEGVVLNASNSTHLQGDFDEIEGGEYNVQVDATDTTANATASVTVQEEVEAVVNFDEAVSTEERGDVATISMTTEGVDQFDLQVGSDDMGYNVTLEGLEPNDEGEVVLEMNSYLAGTNATNEDAAWDYADDRDFSGVNVTLHSDELSEDRRLEAGLYDLSASGQDESGNDVEYDVGVLDLTERSTDDLSVYTAPEEPTDLGTIQDGMDANHVTESDEIAQQDYIVLEIEASGIYGHLDGMSNAELQTYFDGDNQLDISIEQTNPGPNQDATEIGLSSSDAVIVQDADNDTFYVVFQNGEAAGDEFEAAFTATDAYDYVAEGEDESVNGTFTSVERTGSLDADSEGYVTVEPSEGQQISGETSVAPGTDLRVRARATGESPFLKSESATVDSDGTFSAEFDFSDVNEGQEFTASVHNGDFAEAVEAPGRVAEPDPATVSISDQEAEETGDVVTVDSVYLPDGGFVTIHDDTLLEGAAFDSVRGTSDYLSEGEHSNVEVQLDDAFDVGDHEVIAMPHQDTNDNQEYDFVDSEGEEDGAYEDAEGEPITDSATLSVTEEETPTETPDDDGAADDDDGAADDDGAVDDDDDDDDGQTDDQAGFGAVVALVALLGAALLAARRNAF